MYACTVIFLTLCTIVLSSYSAFSQIPILPIAKEAGKKYGITAWYNLGSQTKTDDLGRNSKVEGYGINIKYGSLSFGNRHVEPITEIISVYVLDTSSGQCVPKNKVVCSIDTTPAAKLSFALGYLSYLNIESTLPAFQSNFNVDGAYAGVFLSVPIDNRGKLSAVVGYTGSIVSVEKVNGTYEGEEPIGGEIAFPITMDFSSTPIHEVNLGLSLELSAISKDLDGLTVFAEWTHQFFNVNSAGFTPLSPDIKKGELQSMLGTDMDLSFKSGKFGLSMDF